LPREVVLQAKNLSDAEARFLVADYYQAQEMRKRTDMQVRHLGDRELPRRQCLAFGGKADISAKGRNFR
jgi:hypothetical protein